MDVVISRLMLGAGGESDVACFMRMCMLMGKCQATVCRRIYLPIGKCKLIYRDILWSGEMVSVRLARTLSCEEGLVPRTLNTKKAAS